MTDFRVQRIISQIEKEVYGEKEGANGKLDKDAEISLFNSKVASGEILVSDEDSFKSIMGFEPSKRPAESQARATVPPTTAGGGVNIYWDSSVNIDLVFNVSVEVTNIVDQIHGGITKEELQKIIDSMVEKIQNDKNKDKTEFQQFIVALFDKYAEDAALDLSELKEILLNMSQQLSDQTDLINKSNEALMKLLKSSFETLNNYMGLNTKAIINKMDKDNAKQYEMLSKIYDAIMDMGVSVDELTDFQKQAFNMLMAKLESGDVKLEDIEKGIKDMTALLKSIKENTDMSVELQQKILDAIDKLGFDMTADFNRVITAINNKEVPGMAELQAMFEKVLDAINNNTNVSVANKREIIEAMANIVIPEGGSKVDLTKLENMVQQLLDKTDVTNQLLSDLNLKADVINVTIQSAKQEIIDALKDLPDYSDKIDNIVNMLVKLPEELKYDDTEMLNYLKAILEKIKNHTVEVTVECNCNCGKDEGKHEGIINELVEEAQSRGVMFTEEELASFGYETTAVNEVKQSFGEENSGKLKDGKYLENGKVVIVKGGQKYDLSGRPLN